MAGSVLSVKQINTYIKSLLEGDSRLSFVRIKGEISNFRSHFASGHLYFTLKDSEATLRCVMFRGNASKLRFMPNDSMQVVCTGRISVFEKDGGYQLYVDDIIVDGNGEFSANLEKIKEKLAKEGLFEEARKRKLPKFPRKIAVITSESGAAVKDILNVLNRRYPLCQVLVIPALVQGVEAPQSLCNALDKAYITNDLDLIIIGRGGGSIEDLWCFNDETLARKISASPIPTISAVGHETDFTICDFVADLRAPTPSAAAELAVPDYKELMAQVSHYKKKICNTVTAMVDLKAALYEKIINEYFFKRPSEYLIDTRKNNLRVVLDNIRNSTERTLLNKQKNFEIAVSKLDAMSPLKLLSRGYSVATKNNKIIKSVDCVKEKESIDLRLSDGSINCVIEKVVKNNA